MNTNADTIHSLQNDLHELSNDLLLLEKKRLDTITQLRAAGASWTDVAKPMLITKQAAQQKYGKLIQTTPAVRQEETNTWWTQADVSAGTTPSMIVAPERPAADPADLVQRHASDIAYKFWTEARAAGHEPAVEWNQDKAQLNISVRQISLQGGWVMLSQFTTQHATRRSHRHYYMRAYSQTAPGKKISRYDAFKALERNAK